jgi:glycosyltransferase involved in cell wall biosynthesis
MDVKNRIITEYPFTPTFIETLGEYYYLKYFSQWFNAEIVPLFKYRILPKKITSLYKFFMIKESLFYLKAENKFNKSPTKNLFWLSHRPPLLWKGKLTEKIKSNKLGPIIFNFSDDPFIQSKYTGQDFPRKRQQDFIKGLGKILSNSTSIWMHENRMKDYQNRGLDVADPIILPCAGDPTLFKLTPLPKEKVIGFIASVFGDKKIFKLRNVPLLIDAFRIVSKEHTDAKLLLCGPMNPDVRKYIEKITKGLNVEIIGEWTPYTEVHKIYERSYMIVRSRKKVEIIDKLLGSSQQAYDTAAAGRPLISVGIRGNMPDDLETIISDYTPEDLAEKMLKLLDDRKYADKIGKYNRSMIEKKHSWEHRAKKLYDYIKDRI